VSAPPTSPERLFAEHFAPLYPPELLGDLERVRSEDANPANNAAITAQLDAAAAAFARLAPDAMGEPALVLDRSDASVHELAVRLTRERRDAWAVEGEGGVSRLATLAIHGALYVGACAVASHGAAWLVRRPTWESKVALTSAAGTAELAPFAWWLKALSDDEIGTGRLADRYRALVEVPTFDASTLPVIAPADRRIPRLAKVRYDTLFKHLRAHVPELKDVGADFPSPERVAELALAALDFSLVGGGRMLVLHGANADGLHLFWLDLRGFVKAAFYPADGFPAPVVQVLPADAATPERLRVVLSQGKSARTEELLWWGP
jgi:hypothetical protein